MISYVKKLFVKIATVLIFSLLKTSEAFAETTQAVSPCGGSVSSGYGSESVTQQGSIIGMFFPLLVFGLIFYFFVLRPRRQAMGSQLTSKINEVDAIAPDTFTSMDQKVDYQYFYPKKYQRTPTEARLNLAFFAVIAVVIGIAAGNSQNGLIGFVVFVAIFGAGAWLTEVVIGQETIVEEISDWKYDASVKSNLQNLKKKALERLGIDEDEVKEVQPISFGDYCFDYGLDYVAKQGKDGKWRSNFYKTAIIFFSQNELHSYVLTFCTTQTLEKEQTDVYFYQDIVSVSTSSKIQKVEIGDDKYSFSTEEFTLTTKGGNSITVNVENVSDIQSSVNAMRALLKEKKQGTSNTENSSTPAPVHEITSVGVVSSVAPPKVYEPLVGIETDALIKRAYLFLEDGQFDDAGRYFNQALNQDPEDARIHFGQLMLIHEAHTPEELINKLSMPLENEKLFQRALRFADDEYKSRLESYAKTSRDKIEQERLIKEAEIERARSEKEAEDERIRVEQERIQAEKEAEQERLYQKVLNLKSTVSTILDFDEFLSLINSLMPYKDTNELYNEVYQARMKEADYQNAIQQKQEAKTPDEIQAVINRLEKLKDYKDVDELLSEAREKLIEAEKQKRKKRIFSFLGVIVLVACGIFGYSEYSSRVSEEQRQAQIQRIHQEAEARRIEAQRQAQAKRAEEQRQAEAQRRAEAQRQRNEGSYAKGEEHLNAKDYALALQIFRRLANEGYAPAQDKLAWMYQNGWGVTQDYSQAVRWFREAANQGNMEAQASMGLMYLRGWGVQQNYDTAFEYYSKAAAQGSEVARRRMNSILLLTENMQKILSMKDSPESGHGFPLAGTIFAETLSVRQSPSTKAKSLTTLKTGHPVSISRVTDGDNDYWFYIKTASGTEGWVMMGYVKLVDRNLSYQETSNRNYSLPRVGHVTVSESSSFLNLRNIPSVKGSQVVDKLDDEQQITAYEVFAGDTIDWYKVRTNYGTEGWVSGKYIKIE